MVIEGNPGIVTEYNYTPEQIQAMEDAIATQPWGKQIISGRDQLRRERDGLKARLDLKFPPGTVERRFRGVCAKAVELGLCSGLEAKCASSFLLEYVDQLRRERGNLVKLCGEMRDMIRAGLDENPHSDDELKLACENVAGYLSMYRPKRLAGEEGE